MRIGSLILGIHFILASIIINNGFLALIGLGQLLGFFVVLALDMRRTLSRTK